MKKKNKASVNFIFFAITLFIVIIVNSKKSSNTSSSSNNYSSSNERKPKFEIKWPTPLNENSGEKVSDKLDRKNYYIVFDGSGSMAKSKCSGGNTKEQVAKNALNNFVNQISDEDNIGLYIFDKFGASERVALNHNNKSQILAEIEKSQANGNTPLRTSIAKGVRELAKQAGKQLEYGEYHLIVITDGEASGEKEKPVDVVSVSLDQTPIIIHSIGFCIDQNHSLNQPGKTIYKSADNPQELAKGLESVLAESEEFIVTEFDN